LTTGVEGLMMDLEISPDNRFVAAYTNNNQVIILFEMENFATKNLYKCV
jgi:hypothetical protein